MPAEVSFVEVYDPSDRRAQIRSRIGQAEVDVALVLRRERPVQVLERDGTAHEVGPEGRLLEKDGGGPAFRAGGYVVSGTVGAWTVTEGSVYRVRRREKRDRSLVLDYLLRLPGPPSDLPEVELAYMCELGHVVWQRPSKARSTCEDDGTPLSR